jgi:nitroreductase
MDPLRIDDLFARRSVRSYTTEPVTDDQVHTLLQAAMAAPSAGNRKPWHFVVVRDLQVLAALAEHHPYAKMLPSAPVCFVPCGEPGLGYPGASDFWIQDLAAACENLLLAATGLGLGGVWCGVYPVQERVRDARRVLGIPENVTPFCFMPVGHPDERRERRTQYDADRVHHDHW